MELVYSKIFHLSASASDRFDRLKCSQILDLIQEVAGDHSMLLGTGRNELTQRRLFWAVLRHRVQITRLPRAGEDITVETWPMPTTRTAYPRSTVAFDAEGKELFRAVSLWVLMDMDTRAMVLPGKSGVEVNGLMRGNEPAVPGSLIPGDYQNYVQRTVRFSDLDWNGHMNNCRYLDWVLDTLPSDFHRENPAREFSVCYLSEAKEGETLHLQWQLQEGMKLSVNALRSGDGSENGHSRVFAAQLLF